MAELNPSTTYTATATMTNPTAKAFDYTAILFLGIDRVVEAEASFHLEAGESKPVSFSIVTPAAAGTYPVYIHVSAAGVDLGLYQATEDVVIVSTVEGVPSGFTIANLYIQSETPSVGTAIAISVMATNVSNPGTVHEFIFKVNQEFIDQVAFIPQGETQEVSILYTPQALGVHLVSIGELEGSFTAVEPPPVIGCTITVVNCPVASGYPNCVPGAVTMNTTGEGTWVLCGQPGNWPYDMNVQRPYLFGMYCCAFNPDGALCAIIEYYQADLYLDNGKSYTLDWSTKILTET